MVEPSLFPERPPQPPPSGFRPQSSASGALPPGTARIEERVNEVASRLAVLEERLANMRKKAQLTAQTLIGYEKDSHEDLRALTERLTELARKVEEAHEKINAMSGELSNVVKKHEFSVLERYLDLWEPLSFVTREEAKLLLKAAMEEKK